MSICTRVFHELVRLNRDDKGALASLELLLILPIFLLFWVISWDFGLFQSAKIAQLADNRTAAFLQAQHDSCLTWSNPQEAIESKITVLPSRCSRERWAGADQFWNEMDRAGGQNLTVDVRKAQAPELITASKTTRFRFHPETSFGYKPISDEFTVISVTNYGYQDPVLKAGYNKTLKDRLSRHGAFITLFPNMFP